MHYKNNKSYNIESTNFSCDSINKIYKINSYKKYDNLIKNKKFYKNVNTYISSDEEYDSGYCSSNSDASNHKKIYKNRKFYRSKISSNFQN